MNPKIDITITDSHGDYEMLTSDNFEPYEVCINNELVCTPTRLDELESENTKLKERIKWLEDELRKQRSASATFMEMIKAYQEDDTKLRELVIKNWHIALSERNLLREHKIDPDGGTYVTALDDEIATAKDHMSKLGIEVL